MHVLGRTLKLLHPFMPFVTEEIYLSLPGAGETIMLSDWPKAQALSYEEDAQAMQEVMELIRAVRNIRTEMNVAPSHKAKITVLTENAQAVGMCTEYIKKLAYASDVAVIKDKSDIPENSVSVVCAIGEAFMPLGELIDIGKETERLKKESEKLKGEIKRAEGKLNNAGFVEKAPGKVVAAEREKLETFRDMLAKVEDRIKMLKGIR